MKTRISALAAIVSLLAAGCATAPVPVAVTPGRPEPQVVGGQRLSGDEFRRMVFGNTLDRRLPNGTRLMMHVAGNGEQRLRLVTGSGQTATDRGRVNINGNEVCASWEKIDAGRPTCFAYFRLGEALIAIDLAGTMTPTRFALLPGNPEGI